MDLAADGAPQPPPPVLEQPVSRSAERFPHVDLTNVIIGAAYHVHSELGAGFLESVYANGLTVALRELGLRVERNVAYEIVFHGVVIGRYVADLVVESKVLVEIKAARSIDSAHRAQTLNYLKASNLEVGLILNFGTSVQVKRLARSHSG